MAKFKEGDIIRHEDDLDIMQITKAYESNHYDCILLEDIKKAWSSEVGYTTTRISFDKGYKLFLAYNTPLYKAMHN